LLSPLILSYKLEKTKKKNLHSNEIYESEWETEGFWNFTPETPANHIFAFLYCRAVGAGCRAWFLRHFPYVGLGDFCDGVFLVHVWVLMYVWHHSF
jgi:hypothetical protein